MTDQYRLAAAVVGASKALPVRGRRAAPRICSALPTGGRKSCEAATSFPAQILRNFPPDPEPGMLEGFSGGMFGSIRVEPAAAAAALIEPRLHIVRLSLRSRERFINLYFHQREMEPTRFEGYFLIQKEWLHF